MQLCPDSQRRVLSLLVREPFLRFGSTSTDSKLFFNTFEESHLINV
jgi:hypothetical protein